MTTFKVTCPSGDAALILQVKVPATTPDLYLNLYFGGKPITIFNATKKEPFRDNMSIACDITALVAPCTNFPNSTMVSDIRNNLITDVNLCTYNNQYYAETITDVHESYRDHTDGEEVMVRLVAQTTDLEVTPSC